MASKLNIIIAGAGIGGLSAAANLIQAGFSVKIFEQAPELGEIGAGIQFSANATKVLQHIGVGDELAGAAERPVRYRISMFSTGERLNEFQLAGLHDERFGAPYYVIHRADAHLLLAKRVQDLDPDAIVLNATVERFTQDNGKVTAVMADGSTYTGDVLIGADGIKSVIRAQILGDIPAVFSGDVAWRAIVPAERLPDFMDPIVNIWVGRDRHFVVYYLRQQELINYVAVVEDGSWVEESWTMKAPWEELKNGFEGWHPDVNALIDATDRDQCYKWALNNRPPITEWSEGHATLLGDAAHPTLPYMAQGAAMAIEDAAILTRALQQESNIEDALRLYQQTRFARTEKIVTQSTAHGNLYHQESEEKFREVFAQRDLGADRGAWLFSYDPLTAPLG